MNPRRRRSRRTRRPGLYGPALLYFLLFTAGCGVLSPEEQLLTDFFEASRLHDTTVVASFANVTFNPRLDGVVQDFDVETVERGGDGQSSRVTIAAQVRAPDGRVSARRLEFTLSRQNGRWFISGLNGAP
jgi:hypothetical protein